MDGTSHNIPDYALLRIYGGPVQLFGNTPPPTLLSWTIARGRCTWDIHLVRFGEQDCPQFQSFEFRSQAPCGG